MNDTTTTEWVGDRVKYVNIEDIDVPRTVSQNQRYLSFSENSKKICYGFEIFSILMCDKWPPSSLLSKKKKAFSIRLSLMSLI